MKKIFFTTSLILLSILNFAQTILLNNSAPDTIICSNSYNFYDAGGPSGQYSSGTAQTYIKTFIPSQAGQKIRIDFSSFDVENHFAVYMEIYDGPNTFSPSLGQFNGSNSPGTVVSSAPNGELTVYFTHDNFQGGHQGWDAVISCTSSLSPPVNDDPCGAILLNVTSNPLNYISASLIGATNTSNGITIYDPNCSIYNNGPDVWFKAVVPPSGNLAFITYDSTIYDTGIEAYSGANCNSFNYTNLLACDDDGNSTSLFGTMSRIVLSQQTPGDTIFLRVWKRNGGMGLFNVAAFEYTPSINVIHPNGGEILIQNDNITIDFTTLGVDTVDFEYSINNGTTWNLIQTHWPVANGYYYWVVPMVSSNQCLIRISKTGNPSIFDVSDATFTITAPYIQVTLPNGGEIYQSGQNNVDIYWSSPGFWGNVNILFSDNNGTSWTTLASNIMNYGFWTVNFPNVVSTQCLIKVEDANNPSLFDVSDAAFTLTNNPPTVNILYPAGNEIFTEGQTITIYWTANGFNHLNILFTDGDITGTIASNVPANQNMYVWQIPTGYMTGSNWQIIIEPVNLPWFTQYSNIFTVQSTTPSITIITPSLGQTFYTGSTEIIQWNSSQVNQVNIEYSANYGASWNTIANNVSGNIYFWNVDSVPIPNALIRIYASNNVNLADTSDFFMILNPGPTANAYLDATYSGASTICAGDTIYVNVSATGAINISNFYLLQLSDENGNFTNPYNIGYLYSNFYNESIMGIIPDTLPTSSNYKIRIRSSDSPSISDTINISISAKPIFNFTANPLVNYLPVSGLINYTFNGNPASITSYLWDFGDGGIATTQNSTHNYTNPGFYTVKLTASNLFSCTHTVTKPFYITIEQLFDTDTILTLTTQNILGLSFVNPATGCFSLANGTCLITQDSGLTFTNVPVGLTTPLTSVSLVTGYWLVTSTGGNIAYSTNGGTSWTVQNLGTSDTLFASALLDNTNGYVVGNNGIIFKYNGSNWTIQNSGTTNSLRGVAFSDTDVISVGFNGTIIRSPGNGVWSPIFSPFNSHYRAVAFNDAGIGLAVGDMGRIIRTTDGGISWTPALSGVNVNFASVAISSDSAWAVGTEGVIYKSFDGGLTWIRNSLGVQNNLNGITFYGDEQRRRMGIERAQGSNRGYVVGDGGVARLFGNPIDTSGNSTDIIKLYDFKVLFKVYPVPAVNEITIEGELKTEGLLNIMLKDMYGATVKVIHAQKEKGNVIKRVSLSDLASGIYFIHIESPEQQSIHRIIVSK